MEKNNTLVSLSDYRKQYEQQMNAPQTIVELKSEKLQKKTSDLSISPFSSGKMSQISANARKNALRFAHPVDQSIIAALDNPIVNSVFNKVVQTSIDANFGLSLAQGIHISPTTYGDLYEIVADCAEKLGIPIPYVIISDSVRGVNACTAGTDQFSFIAISSVLPLVMSKEELAFVIGHECGHIALGHVVYHTAATIFGQAGGLIPVVGDVVAKTIQMPLKAWSRRSEISADRAGLICCGDIQIAKRALFKLEAGLLRVDGIDMDEYIREAERVLDSSALGRYTEIFNSHPIIPKRIKALDYFANSKLYQNITGKDMDSNTRLLSDKDLISKTEKIIEVW